MSYAEYIIPAYLVVMGAIAGVHGASWSRAGAALGRGVPDEDKPWT